MENLEKDSGCVAVGTPFPMLPKAPPLHKGRRLML